MTPLWGHECHLNIGAKNWTFENHPWFFYSNQPWFCWYAKYAELYKRMRYWQTQWTCIGNAYRKRTKAPSPSGYNWHAEKENHTWSIEGNLPKPNWMACVLNSCRAIQRRQQSIFIPRWKKYFDYLPPSSVWLESSLGELFVWCYDPSKKDYLISAA